jgi:hypothetical protein
MFDKSATLEQNERHVLANDAGGFLLSNTNNMAIASGAQG